MIYSYGVSLPGTYHIKNNIVCQDSHQILHVGKQMAIAAVADGLGVGMSSPFRGAVRLRGAGPVVVKLNAEEKLLKCLSVPTTQYARNITKFDVFGTNPVTG